MKEKTKTKFAKIRTTLLTVLLGMILGGGLYFGVTHFFSSVSDGETTITSTEIRDSFGEIEELAVEEYDVTDVGKFSEDDMKVLGIPIPFTGKSFLLTYSGTVKAGIKAFDQIEVAVDEKEKKVKLVLPKVEILDAYIDPDSIETYDQSYHIFNQIKVEDVTKFQKEEVEKLKTSAVEKGILERAGKRNEEILKMHVQTLLAHTTYEGYDVLVTSKTD